MLCTEWMAFCASARRVDFDGIGERVGRGRNLGYCFLLSTGSMGHSSEGMLHWFTCACRHVCARTFLYRCSSWDDAMTLVRLERFMCVRSEESYAHRVTWCALRVDATFVCTTRPWCTIFAQTEAFSGKD